MDCINTYVDVTGEGGVSFVFPHTKNKLRYMAGEERESGIFPGNGDFLKSKKFV